MADFPVIDGHRFEAVGHVTGSSVGTTVTGGASNTKGASWTQLIASTAFDASALTVSGGNVFDNGDVLFDLAIGGSGSEVVILSNIKAEGNDRTQPGAIYTFPISVPAGSRLSAKSQSTTASVALRVAVGLLGQGMMEGPPLQQVTTYGANTADSGGTSVDPGGSANTLVWTQITASTSRDHQGFIVALGNQTNVSRTTGSWLVSLAVGAAAGEQTLATWLVFCDDSADLSLPNVSPFIPAVVPAGARIAVGARSTITDATDRLLDAIVYGVS